MCITTETSRCYYIRILIKVMTLLFLFNKFA